LRDVVEYSAADGSERISSTRAQVLLANGIGRCRTELAERFTNRIAAALLDVLQFL
jgi:hypothetical protein